MTQTIRKEGKAKWAFECGLCGVRVTRPDHFRAIEAKQRHQRTSDHMFNALAIAVQPAVDAYATIVKAAADLADTVRGVFAPAPNRPHDPALLRDRRKWGGR